jgi:hypothetical protein
MVIQNILMRDPYCKDLNWLYDNADSYFGQKLNC